MLTQHPLSCIYICVVYSIVVGENANDTFLSYWKKGRFVEQKFLLYMWPRHGWDWSFQCHRSLISPNTDATHFKHVELRFWSQLLKLFELDLYVKKTCVAEQSVTKIISMFQINLMTYKVVAMRDILFDLQASEAFVEHPWSRSDLSSTIKYAPNCIWHLWI